MQTPPLKVRQMQIIRNLHVCTCTVGSTQCPECMVYGIGAMAAIFHCACLFVNMKLLFNHRYLSQILGPSTRHVYEHTHCVHTCARLVRGPSTDRQTHTQTHSYISKETEYHSTTWNTRILNLQSMLFSTGTPLMTYPKQGSPQSI